MAAFIVVPKIHQGGRSRSFEIIDTEPDRPHRARFGFIDDEVQAAALASVLNGAEAVYRAEVAKSQNLEPF